jgi:endonuclease YncB( thermonuclease family)
VNGRPFLRSFSLLTDRFQNGGRIVCVVALALCVPSAEEAIATEAILGSPHVVDGDTLQIAGVKIRLQGINAPETDQVCLDQSSAKWTCGIAARDHLAHHIGGRPIECLPDGVDRYHRTLAVCQVGEENLNTWVVREGFALAFIKYSRAYLDEGVEVPITLVAPSAAIFVLLPPGRGWQGNP